MGVALRLPPPGAIFVSFHNSAVRAECRPSTLLDGFPSITLQQGKTKPVRQELERPHFTPDEMEVQNREFARLQVAERGSKPGVLTPNPVIAPPPASVSRQMQEPPDGMPKRTFWAKYFGKRCKLFFPLEKSQYSLAY